jgi:acyl-CoA thioester hydrolase
MHFPNALLYVERAEHELLTQRGLLVFDRALGGWPRVQVACEYDHPLVCGDAIEVRLTVANVGRTSVRWTFEIIRKTDETRAAHGSMTTVRVNHKGQPQELSPSERAVLLPNHP